MAAFESKVLPHDRDAIAPDGSEVRVLSHVDAGGMAHFRLLPGQISRAVTHRTVEEIWYVVGGAGEMWRSQHGRTDIVGLKPGVCVNIPVGTHFQFRASGTEPLDIVGVTMPRWPGAGEARAVMGPWVSNTPYPEADTPATVKRVKDHVLVQTPFCGLLREILTGAECAVSVAVLDDVTRTRAHYHNSFDEIYFVLGGTITVRLLQPKTSVLEEVTLQSLELCVIPRTVHHQIVTASDANRLCVLCTPAFDPQDEHLSDLLDTEPLRPPVPDDQGIAAS